MPSRRSCAARRKRGLGSFSKLLRTCARTGRVISNETARRCALADGDPDARLPVGSGYVDGVNALADERSPRLAPDWPLLTFGLEDDASAATDGDERGRVARCHRDERVLLTESAGRGTRAEAGLRAASPRRWVFSNGARHFRKRGEETRV